MEKKEKRYENILSVHQIGWTQYFVIYNIKQYIPPSPYILHSKKKKVSRQSTSFSYAVLQKKKKKNEA